MIMQWKGDVKTYPMCRAELAARGIPELIVRTKWLPIRTDDALRRFSAGTTKSCSASSRILAVRGCMVIRPRGYGIWEGCNSSSTRCSNTGHETPTSVFIPESFMKKEPEHVRGLRAGDGGRHSRRREEARGALIVRPTSETIIYAMYAKWVQSYRDLRY